MRNTVVLKWNIGNSSLFLLYTWKQENSPIQHRQNDKVFQNSSPSSNPPKGVSRCCSPSTYSCVFLGQVTCQMKRGPDPRALGGPEFLGEAKGLKVIIIEYAYIWSKDINGGFLAATSFLGQLSPAEQTTFARRWCAIDRSTDPAPALARSDLKVSRLVRDSGLHGFQPGWLYLVSVG